MGWWGGGGTWGPLDRGVATLSFSVRSSSLDMGGLFCNLQVVFWFIFAVFSCFIRFGEISALPSYSTIFFENYTPLLFQSLVKKSS